MLGGSLIFMIFGYSLSSKLKFKEPFFQLFKKYKAFNFDSIKYNNKITSS
jgi:hypothetical protein